MKEGENKDDSPILRLGIVGNMSAGKTCFWGRWMNPETPKGSMQVLWGPYSTPTRFVWPVDNQRAPSPCDFVMLKSQVRDASAESLQKHRDRILAFCSGKLSPNSPIFNLPKDVIRLIFSFVELDHRAVRVQFWNERYDSRFYNEKHLRGYIRSMRGIIVAFSLSDKESFEHCFNWVHRYHLISFQS
jgi:GTPase SAR1 family protein